MSGQLTGKMEGHALGSNSSYNKSAKLPKPFLIFHMKGWQFGSQRQRGKEVLS